MKHTRKYALIVILFLSIIFLLLAFICNPARMVQTASLLLGIAGILQLEITDFFKEITNEYCDEKKYPFGPPSYITREIIDNPYTPVRQTIKNYLFYYRHTGVWILIISCCIQIVATWL